MSHIALYTFGLLDPEIDADARADFVRRGGEILASADGAPGFLGRPARAVEGPETHEPGEDYGPWGRYALPELTEFAGHDPQVHIATLSLWQDVESAGAFVYHGHHREALRRRDHWFLRGDWPGYVLWAIDDHAVPRWQEGVDRFEALARDGESMDGFSFAWGRTHA